MKYLLLALILVPVVLAHGGVEHEDAIEAQDHIQEVGVYASINPFYYWSSGQYLASVIAFVIWIGSVVMLTILAIPLLMRLFTFPKEN